VFFVALQLWWVDRITRIGRAAYAPKRCLNTLMNIERETFFGKQIMCFVTLWSKDITILCGLENNTRQQTTHTISATFFEISKMRCRRAHSIFLKFQKEETSLKFPSQWEKKRKERMWCHSIFKYKYSKSIRNAKLY